mgnify:CR=1 FL=1
MRSFSMLTFAGARDPRVPALGSMEPFKICLFCSNSTNKFYATVTKLIFLSDYILQFTYFFKNSYFHDYSTKNPVCRRSQTQHAGFSFYSSVFVSSVSVSSVSSAAPSSDPLYFARSSSALSGVTISDCRVSSFSSSLPSSTARVRSIGR